MKDSTSAALIGIATGSLMAFAKKNPFYGELYGDTANPAPRLLVLSSSGIVSGYLYAQAETKYLMLPAWAVGLMAMWATNGYVYKEYRPDQLVLTFASGGLY